MSSDLAPETPAAPAPAKGLAGKLQKKVGPFPLWLWLGVGGGAALLLLRGKSGSGGSTGGATGDPVTDPVADPGIAPGGGGIDPGPVPIGNLGGFEDPFSPPFDFGDPGPSPNPEPEPTTAAGVTHPILSYPGLRDYVLRNTGYYTPHYDASGVAHPVNPYGRGDMGTRAFAGVSGPDRSYPASSTWASILAHAAGSSAARIAAATTPFSVSPSGRTVASAATPGRRVFGAE